MTIESTTIDAESPATLRPSGMYFVPLTGRPFDVTDETLAVWATEDLRTSRRSPDSGVSSLGVGSRRVAR